MEKVSGWCRRYNERKSIGERKDKRIGADKNKI